MAGLLASLLTGCVNAQSMAETTGGNKVDDREIASMMEKHCISCHAAEPSNEIYAAPAGGLSLETLASVREFAWEIRLQTVDSDLMPLGNTTDMTQAEREQLGSWLNQQEDQ